MKEKAIGSVWYKYLPSFLFCMLQYQRKHSKQMNGHSKRMNIYGVYIVHAANCAFVCVMNIVSSKMCQISTFVLAFDWKRSSRVLVLCLLFFLQKLRKSKFILLGIISIYFNCFHSFFEHWIECKLSVIVNSKC